MKMLLGRENAQKAGATNRWRELKTAFTVVVVSVTTAVGSPAKVTFIDLVKFDQTNGANPYSVLVEGRDGSFYGTAALDGANGNYGTIFKVTAKGKRTTLYSFCPQSGCPDGYFPLAGLVQGTDGNFYGTTQFGGSGKGGTVFRITPKGKFTLLYAFCSQTNCTDGSAPYGPLVQGTDGRFYGTTSASGAHKGGTVFKIARNGKLTTLYAFCSQSKCKDGDSPTHGVVLGADGDFYGTTGEGGTHGGGTAFKITPKGTLTRLYSFCAKASCADGSYPYGGLVQSSDGNFYGTTTFGGSLSGGSIFTMTPQGKLTVLYSFCSKKGCTDGEEPYAGLVRGTDGNFYGTTAEGGTSGGGEGVVNPPNELGTYGTAFKITPKGVLTTLYNFCSKAGCADGSFPYAELVQGTDGGFYGATSFGGDLRCTQGCGTVFALATGLGAFVRTQPGSGKVGAAVVVLGNNLTGATSVTFNGTAAKFTVVSKTEIMATVPNGATSGIIAVKTPAGTLSNHRVFQVIK